MSQTRLLVNYHVSEAADSPPVLERSVHSVDRVHLS